MKMLNNIDKLNNMMTNIEEMKKKRKEREALSFDDISLDNLGIQLVVGSKVTIQSEKTERENVLDEYLGTISEYRLNRDKKPKYALDLSDLNLDVDLEITQKFLVKKNVGFKKTQEEIKREKDIQALENLKTSIFLYNNLDKTPKYKASFDDLHLDIEVEKKVVTKTIIKPFKNVTKAKKRIQLNSEGDKIKFLREKLENIEKFKQMDKKHHDMYDAKNINLGVTLSKSGNQVISLTREDKINKLKGLLDSIKSYREQRHEL